MSVIVFYKMPFLRVLFLNIVFFREIARQTDMFYFMFQSFYVSVGQMTEINCRQTRQIESIENKHHHCYNVVYSSCIKSVSCDEISSTTSAMVLSSTSTNVVHGSRLK